jgi:hypothetical protein
MNGQRATTGRDPNEPPTLNRPGPEGPCAAQPGCSQPALPGRYVCAAHDAEIKARGAEIRRKHPDHRNDHQQKETA